MYVCATPPPPIHHLGRFCVLAMVDGDAVNIGMHIIFKLWFSWIYAQE